MSSKVVTFRLDGARLKMWEMIRSRSSDLGSKVTFRSIIEKEIDRLFDSMSATTADYLPKVRKTHKLTVDQVMEIRRLLSQGIRKKEIAKMFSVTPGTITHISRGRTWKVARKEG